MRKKYTAILTALGVALGALAAFSSYKWKIGQDVHFNSDILKIKNPFLIEKEINRCTIVEGTVYGFIYSENAIILKVDGAPSKWDFYAYLSKNQLEQIKLDQKITIRGIFRVKLAETAEGYNSVFIGNSILNAEIMEID